MSPQLGMLAKRSIFASLSMEIGDASAASAAFRFRHQDEYKGLTGVHCSHDRRARQ